MTFLLRWAAKTCLLLAHSTTVERRPGEDTVSAGTFKNYASCFMINVSLSLT